MRPPPPWPGARAPDRRRPKGRPTTGRSSRSGTRRSPSSRAASRRRSTRGGTNRRPSCSRRRGHLRGVPPIVRRARGIAPPLHDVGERAEDRDEEPGEPDALALAAAPDQVHPVVPVARAHERQAVGARGQADRDRAEAVLVQASLSRKRPTAARRLRARPGSAGGRSGTAPPRRAPRRRPSRPRIAASHTPATACRRRIGCERPGRPARATSAGRLLRRTDARRRAAGARGRATARTSPAPGCPAADRGIRRRRWTDRTPIAPRRGTPASDRAASD